MSVIYFGLAGWIMAVKNLEEISVNINMTCPVGYLEAW